MKNPRGEQPFCFIGVDGGATRTRCAVADEKLCIVGEAETGPSNPLRVGIDAAVRELEAVVLLAVGEAAEPPGEVVAGCFGLAGVRRGNCGAKIEENLRQRFGVSRIIVETDAVIALTAAVPGERGVVALSGTGFVAYGSDGEGETAYADGLGPLLGDEGSAYRVGIEAMRSAARELDGRGAEAGFTGPLLASLGVEDLDALTELSAAAEPAVSRIASLAPLVLRACENGCAVSRRIVEDAAVSITRSVKKVAESVGLLGSSFPVALCGGLLSPGSVLERETAARISVKVQGANLLGKSLPPAYGALIRAAAIKTGRSPEECHRLLSERLSAG